jgi:hypothetical protein
MPMAIPRPPTASGRTAIIGATYASPLSWMLCNSGMIPWVVDPELVCQYPPVDNMRHQYELFNVHACVPYGAVVWAVVGLTYCALLVSWSGLREMICRLGLTGRENAAWVRIETATRTHVPIPTLSIRVMFALQSCRGPDDVCYGFLDTESFGAGVCTRDPFVLEENLMKRTDASDLSRPEITADDFFMPVTLYPAEVRTLLRCFRACAFVVGVV